MSQSPVPPQSPTRVRIPAVMCCLYRVHNMPCPKQGVCPMSHSKSAQYAMKDAFGSGDKIPCPSFAIEGTCAVGEDCRLPHKTLQEVVDTFLSAVDARNKEQQRAPSQARSPVPAQQQQLQQPHQGREENNSGRREVDPKVPHLPCLWWGCKQKHSDSECNGPHADPFELMPKFGEDWRPPCAQFVFNNECSAGDRCLYAHVPPAVVQTVYKTKCRSKKLHPLPSPETMKMGFNTADRKRQRSPPSWVRSRSRSPSSEQPRRLDRPRDEGKGFPDFAVGTKLLSETFKVLRPLGKGAFSKVYLCEDVATGEQIALKVFRSDHAMTRRATDEAKILRRLEGLRCGGLGLYGINEMLASFASTGAFPYASIAFRPLGDSVLINLEERKKAFSRGFPVPVVRSILFQVLTALKVAHKGNILHADVKPENILFQSVQPPLRSDRGMMSFPAHTAVTLIDWGNAEVIGETPRMPDIQTSHYRAPEVIVDAAYDTKADVWSVGCLIPELLSGECFFTARSAPEHLFAIESRIGTLGTAMQLPILRQGTQFSRLTGSSKNGNVIANTRSISNHTLRVLESQPKLSTVINRAASDDPDRDALLNLAQMMLAVDPALRLSVEEALNHRFFTGCASF